MNAFIKRKEINKMGETVAGVHTHTHTHTHTHMGILYIKK